MDIYRDELRRQLRDLDREHREVMPRWRDSLLRLLVDDRESPTEAKASLLLGGFNRRRFLRLAGAGLAGGTLLAACGDDEGDGAADETTSTTGGEGRSNAARQDATIARTAASLEIFAVGVYDKAIGNAQALGISQPVAGAAQVFRTQHDEHAKAFNAAATELGGQPFEMANPTAQQQFQSQIDGLKTEQDVVAFAYELEQIASQTYQGVGARMLSTPMLRQTAMSVGGVEARHAAVLAMFVKPPVAAPDSAFQPTEKAADSSFFV